MVPRPIRLASERARASHRERVLPDADEVGCSAVKHCGPWVGKWGGITVDGGYLLGPRSLIVRYMYMYMYSCRYRSYSTCTVLVQTPTKHAPSSDAHVGTHHTTFCPS